MEGPDLLVRSDRYFYDADLHQHDHHEGPSPAGLSAAAGPVIDDVRVTAAPNMVKTKVWNTWTGGSVSSTTAPQATDPAWHPTNGDPQSKLHKAENHKVNEPYFVPKGKSGGAWFMWSEVHRLIHQHHQQPVPLRRGGLFASRKTNLWHSASPGQKPGSWPDAFTTASKPTAWPGGPEAMNTTQTQALAPSSAHPWCRDGSGHTNALPLTTRRASAMNTP